MNDFYRVQTKLKEYKDTRFALATVIGVEGSAYRHVGAKMLIGDKGEQFGTISAGCLEEDLAYQAQNIIKTGIADTFIYDLRSEDDLSWGQGAGCNGSVKVYVEPYEWGYIPSFHSEPFWPRVEIELELGYKVATVKGMGENPTERIYLSYSERGVVIGNAVEKLKDNLLQKLMTFLDSGKRLETIQIPGCDNTFLLELYEPREKLLIFGAGPDVEPLARHASALDFSVTIVDPRSGRCNKENFPTVDYLIVEHPESYLNTHHISPNTFVLIMTHSFLRDSYLLQQLIPYKPKYLGALGPRRRTERLVYPNLLPNWVYSPIGLNINAEGPEEISISIVAQLLQVRNQSKKPIKLNELKV
jgi:xanthine dehydrogenase accessory factor